MTEENYRDLPEAEKKVIRENTLREFEAKLDALQAMMTVPGGVEEKFENALTITNTIYDYISRPFYPELSRIIETARVMTAEYIKLDHNLPRDFVDKLKTFGCLYDLKAVFKVLNRKDAASEMKYGVQLIEIGNQYLQLIEDKVLVPKTFSTTDNAYWKYIYFAAKTVHYFYY